MHFSAKIHKHVSIYMGLTIFMVFVNNKQHFPVLSKCISSYAESWDILLLQIKGLFIFCLKLKYLQRNPGARQLFLRGCSCFGNTPYPQLLWPGCLAIATSPELKLLKSLSLHSMWEDMDTAKSILAHVWV